MQKIIVFGSSEIAELAKYYFEEEEKAEVVAFTVDDEYIKEDNFLGCPIVPFSKLSESFPPSEFNMHVALSYKRLNKLREEKYFQAKNSGYKLESFISNNSVISSNASIGDNCFILENQTIQPLVSIGSNVMLWSGNHIGHGTSIGDHSYLASHVVVSGNCKIGQRCFFGVNSTLKDYLEIGNDCFISMDASITKDLNNGSVVLPAKSNYFEADAELAIKIKKNYFGI